MKEYYIIKKTRENKTTFFKRHTAEGDLYTNNEDQAKKYYGRDIAYHVACILAHVSPDSQFQILKQTNMKKYYVIKQHVEKSQGVYYLGTRSGHVDYTDNIYEAKDFIDFRDAKDRKKILSLDHPGVKFTIIEIFNDGTTHEINDQHKQANMKKYYLIKRFSIFQAMYFKNTINGLANYTSNRDSAQKYYSIKDVREKIESLRKDKPCHQYSVIEIFNDGTTYEINADIQVKDREGIDKQLQLLQKSYLEELKKTHEAEIANRQKEIEEINTKLKNL